MITLLVLTVCLFILGLLFGRRFGMLVLALSAGLVVSQYMAPTILLAGASYVKHYESYVPPMLVVLPSLFLLLVTKGKHRKLVPRIINAAAYALAGLIFVIAAPSTPVSLTRSFPVITHNLGFAITGFVILALLEIAFGKASKKKVTEEPHK